MIGFKFDEVMTGTCRISGEDRFMEFRVRWGGPLKELLGILTGSAILPLSGTMTIDGICVNEPCEGTIELAYREGRIGYDISFIAPPLGIRYRFCGSKKGIRPWNLHRTHTTCYGVVRGLGTVDAVLYFRLRTLPAFLASFRLTTEP